MSLPPSLQCDNLISFDLKCAKCILVNFQVKIHRDRGLRAAEGLRVAESLGVAHGTRTAGGPEGGPQMVPFWHPKKGCARNFALFGLSILTKFPFGAWAGFLHTRFCCITSG